jgi:hypothetical protein
MKLTAIEICDRANKKVRQVWGKQVMGGVFSDRTYVLHCSVVAEMGFIDYVVYYVSDGESGETLGLGHSKGEAIASARDTIKTFQEKGIWPSVLDEGRLMKEDAQRRHEEWRQSIFNAPERKREPRKTFVYIIKVAHLYKIGKSLNPQSRIKGMTLPDAPETVRIFDAPNGDELERALHKKFKKNREHGEWFSLTGEHIAEIDAFVEQWKQSQAVAA